MPHPIRISGSLALLRSGADGLRISMTHSPFLDNHYHIPTFSYFHHLLNKLPAMRKLPFFLLIFISSFSNAQTRPFVLGLIDQIHSVELSENRILNIYLPEGYSASDTVTYPVVYLLDGSADEDFIHVVGLYQFNSFPWIDRVPKS